MTLCALARLTKDSIVTAKAVHLDADFPKYILEKFVVEGFFPLSLR